MELARLAKIRAEREAAAKRADEEVKAKVYTLTTSGS